MSQVALLQRFRDNTGIPSSEFPDAVVSTWLSDALGQHNRRYSFATLPPIERDAVVYLAWSRACLARAAAASQFYSVRGQDGGGNKAEILRNNLELRTSLREQYAQFCQSIGVNPAPEIIVTEFTTFDPTVHAMVPLTAHPAPLPTLLRAHSYTGASVDLSWAEAVPREPFYKYHLYVRETPGLKDMTVTEGSHKGVSEDATFLWSTGDIGVTSRRLTGFDENTTQYFVVVVEDLNDRFSVSNEVAVGASALAQEPSGLSSMQFALPGPVQGNTAYATGIVMASAVVIEAVSIQAAKGPSGGVFDLYISRESAVLQDSLKVSVADGENAASVSNQQFTISPSESLNVVTGEDVNGAENVIVTVFYRLVKTTQVYNPDTGTWHTLQVRGEGAYQRLETV